jgi:hypothetical protein
MPDLELLVPTQDSLLALTAPQTPVHVLQIDHVLLKDICQEPEFGCGEPVLVVAKPMQIGGPGPSPTEWSQQHAFHD